MKRFALYIFYNTVFLLALILSIAITYIWNDQYWKLGVGSFATCVNAEEGFSGGGGFSSYVFYDGMKLAFYDTKFDSPEAAKLCFQSVLQNVGKIVEREILFDKAHEKVVGERVVVIFPPDEYTKNERTMVMSLDGNRIFEISSPSLRRTLKFEKEIRKY